MSDQQFVIQYRLTSFGGPDDLQRRHQIEDLLESAMQSADLGFCDGGDIGSGTKNIFVYAADRNSAEELIIRTLRKNGRLEGATIAVCADPGKDQEYQVVWPEDFTGTFAIL